jgi:long-chain acyl-CoA synthetase
MAEHGFWSYAQRQPEALALVDPDERRWSRGELLAQCNQLVHGLRDLGLRHGDVVAIDAVNCAEYFVTALACTQAGWYLTPINWHLAPPEVAYILGDSGAKAFIGHERVAEACVKAADEVGFPSNARFAIGRVPGFRPFTDLTAGYPTEMPADRASGAVMNYTSGTTGNPKGVKRALPPAEIEPDVVAGFFGLFLSMFGIQPEDGNVHICGSPLYHTAVLMNASSALHFGHAVVLMDKWTPEDMLRLIETYRCTTSHMVPTQFNRLLALPAEVRARYDCSSTRTMIHAAAPCPPEIKKQMLDWWGDSIYEYYAATEGGGTIVTPQEWRRYPGTVGKAWPSAEIRILDDDGNPVPTGEQGTVYILLGDTTNFEYKGDAQKTKTNRVQTADGKTFFTVGDVGYLNDEGFLFLCDRKIDMIISGGANIYPAEVENVLVTHPKVVDAAVFGIPHDDWGEEVKAVVETAPGVESDAALTDELLAYCRERLAKFKCPRSIDYTRDMPRDPNGKLYKRKLRDPYWEGRERGI